jgi:hypothetical protein
MLRDYAVHPHRWRGGHIYYSSHKDCRLGSVFVRQTRFSSDTLSGTESVDFFLFISWNLFSNGSWSNRQILHLSVPTVVRLRRLPLCVCAHVFGLLAKNGIESHIYEILQINSRSNKANVGTT